MPKAPAERHTSWTVGKNLARLRGQMGTTAGVLAASLVENGIPMTGGGISDIERGKRGVHVDLLTGIAAALGVSPLALLTPIPDDGNPDGEVILSGTSPETADHLYLWLKGERSLTDDLLDDYERETFRRRSNPTWTWGR